MYDHIGLKVGNLDASVRFYAAVLAPLGYVLCSRDETGAGFDPRASRRSGFTCTRGRPPPAAISRSAHPIMPPSPNSTPPA